MHLGEDFSRLAV